MQLNWDKMEDGVRNVKFDQAVNNVIKANAHHGPPSPGQMKHWQSNGFDRAPSATERALIKRSRLQWSDATPRVMDDVVKLAMKKLRSEFAA